jgi:hypothetical protein
MRAPLFAALVLGGLTSCTVDTDESIFIEGVLPPNDECKVSAGDIVFQPSGVYDIGGARSGYDAALKVRTNLPSTFSSGDVGQSKTQSPNFPNYGPVDNNVVIFESAVVEYEIQTDAATGDALQAASESVGQNLTCTDGVCTIKAQTVTATGTVFNTQTNLNAASIATAELVPLSLANALNDIVVEAGSATPLASPGGRLRLIATVSIVSSTTGNGDLRKIKSFPLPYPIDLCRGCLLPSEELCEEFTAIPFGAVDADGEPLLTCRPGQDVPSAGCFCVERNAAGQPTSPLTPTKLVTAADSCDVGG